MVPDYAAGIDAASGFERAFAGKIVGRTRTRWRPTHDLDFEPILKKAKDSDADTIFAFYPGGKPGFEFLRQFKTTGLVGKMALATSFTVDELSLRSLQEHNVGGVWGTSSTQRMFRVQSGVLNDLGISEGDLIIADCSDKAIAALAGGSPVIAEMGNGTTGEKALLLRQHIAPHLLITNSADQNSLSIHVVKSPVKITGIVLR
jgi:hypothetical protein